MISVDSEKTRILLEGVNNLSPYVVGYPHPLQTLVDVLTIIRIPLLALAAGLALYYFVRTLPAYRERV